MAEWPLTRWGVVVKVEQLPLWDYSECYHRWDFLHDRRGKIDDRIVVAVWRCRYCGEFQVRPT